MYALFWICGIEIAGHNDAVDLDDFANFFVDVDYVEAEARFLA